MNDTPGTKTLRSMLASSGFRRYFSNTGWMFVEKLFSLFVGLAVGIYVARYLGPVQYGILNYALSFVGLYMVFCTLGLEELLVRELVARPDERLKLLGTAFALKLCGAVILLGGVYLGIAVLEIDRYTSLLVMLVACGLVFEPLRVFEHAFRAEVQAKYVSWATIVTLVLVNGFRVGLMWRGADLVWFAVAVVMQRALLGFFLYLFYKGRIGDVLGKWREFRPDTAVARRLMRDAWPLIPADFVFAVLLRIDCVMLNHLATTRDVGVYSAAMRLYDIFLFIPAVFCSSFFPALIRAGDSFARRFKSLLLLIVASGVLCALVQAFIGKYGLVRLFGEEYRDAGPLLMVLSLGFLPLAVCSFFYRILLVFCEERAVFVTAVSGAAVNVFLNYVLIRGYSAMGAAVASSISMVVVFLVPILLSGKLRRALRGLPVSG